MKQMRVVAWVPVVLLLVAACGGDDDNPPGTSLSGQVRALTDGVRGSLLNPSGNVNADALKALLGNSGASSVANSALNQVGGGNTAPGGTDGTECVQGTTVDLGCSTGGALTGSVTYETSTEGGTTFFYSTYNNVCDTAENLCLSGPTGYEMTTNGSDYDMLFGAQLTVTENGSSYSFQFGYQYIVQSSTTTVSYVMYYNGESFVLVGAFDETSGSLTVKGSNGQYTCTYTDDGAHGECNSGEFSW